jgi:hypothetical protein
MTDVTRRLVIQTDGTVRQERLRCGTGLDGRPQALWTDASGETWPDLGAELLETASAYTPSVISGCAPLARAMLVAICDQVSQQRQQAEQDQWTEAQQERFAAAMRPVGTLQRVQPVDAPEDGTRVEYTAPEAPDGPVYSGTVTGAHLQVGGPDYCLSVTGAGGTRTIWRRDLVDVAPF